MHPNTIIGITKFIFIKKEIEMKTKYSFLLFILVYQTKPKFIFYFLYLNSFIKQINFKSNDIYIIY